MANELVPVRRVTAVAIREAFEAKRCINPGCNEPLPENRTLPTCKKCAAGMNADDRKDTVQLIEANKRDMRRLCRRQLMAVNETTHIMALKKNDREQVRRKEFNVRGILRLTRRVLVDTRK